MILAAFHAGNSAVVASTEYHCMIALCARTLLPRKKDYVQLAASLNAGRHAIQASPPDKAEACMVEASNTRSLPEIKSTISTPHQLR